LQHQPYPVVITVIWIECLHKLRRGLADPVYPQIPGCTLCTQILCPLEQQNPAQQSIVNPVILQSESRLHELPWGSFWRKEVSIMCLTSYSQITHRHLSLPLFDERASLVIGQYQLGQPHDQKKED